MCLTWVLFAMMELQPDAPWAASYHDTANMVCEVVREAPIYDDADQSASLLVSVMYFESRFDPHPLAGPSVCMAQISRAWIEHAPTLKRCLTVAATLLRSSLERYGDLRQYTHGMPYPKVDWAGRSRLQLAKRIYGGRQ